MGCNSTGPFVTRRQHRHQSPPENSQQATYAVYADVRYTDDVIASNRPAGVPYSFAKSRETLEYTWRAVADMQADKKMLWTVGYRPVSSPIYIPHGVYNDNSNNNNLKSTSCLVSLFLTLFLSLRRRRRL